MQATKKAVTKIDEILLPPSFGQGLAALIMFIISFFGGLAVFLGHGIYIWVSLLRPIQIQNRGTATYYIIYCLAGFGQMYCADETKEDRPTGGHYVNTNRHPSCMRARPDPDHECLTINLTNMCVNM
jgi:hypothetical protein